LNAMFSRMLKDLLDKIISKVKDISLVTSLSNLKQVSIGNASSNNCLF
jgi:hypothetical protein